VKFAAGGIGEGHRGKKAIVAGDHALLGKYDGALVHLLMRDDDALREAGRSRCQGIDERRIR
jgi:hypothetical protein